MTKFSITHKDLDRVIKNIGVHRNFIQRKIQEEKQQREALLETERIKDCPPEDPESKKSIVKEYNEVPKISRSARLVFEMTGGEFIDLFLHGSYFNNLRIYKVDERGNEIGKLEVTGMMSIEEHGIFEGCGLENKMDQGLNYVRSAMLRKFRINGKQGK